ncbi:hypothetical protein GCM10009663_42400 [Kitasatospora arboriphila]|uniref:Uncharacterized protein n=1 Tax=Kitasatospora arboriphila TaxID=258052 RepID=A0ABN1TMQ1_9ACTN
MIAEIAGREALLARPTRKAVTAIATRSWQKPRTAVDTAVPSCAASRVGRRPQRSASTPPPTAAIAEPRPKSEATRPA